MTVRRAIFPLVFASIAFPSEASAHALLLSSNPAPNATTTEHDLPLRLRFNSRIDQGRSKITLFAPNGREMALVSDPDSPLDGLNASAKDLTVGVWRIRWQVLSIDGHITRGDIEFTVR